MLVGCATCIPEIPPGCSTSGSLKIHESIRNVTIKEAVVDLNVIPVNSNWNNVSNELKEQIANQLRRTSLSEKKTDESADYKISITLEEVYEVSGENRSLFGVLLGPNKISGDVTVINIKTNQLVRYFSFQGESSSHPYSVVNDIGSAIYRAAEEIIRGIQ